MGIFVTQSFQVAKFLLLLRFLLNLRRSRGPSWPFLFKSTRILLNLSFSLFLRYVLLSLVRYFCDFWEFAAFLRFFDFLGLFPLFLSLEFCSICYSCYFCNICYSVLRQKQKILLFLCDFCEICSLLEALLCLFSSLIIKSRIFC